MPRVKLIVTGDMEKRALHESLQRFFPDAREGEAVTWERPRKSQCATSYQLPHEPFKPSPVMLTLARAMLDEAGVHPWRPGAAELVIVVEDLELGNLGREDVIVRHFRAAVEEILDSFEIRTQERYRERLQERCSFHLFNSMVETYLFGDPGALHVAGVAGGRKPRLVDLDIENFETDDPAWLPTCRAESANYLAAGVAWWRHERHPKKYLEHLTKDNYDEIEHGVPALKALDWSAVGRVASHVRVVRCLFEDLAEWFGTANPLAAGACHGALFPPRSVNRAGMLLRNC
jgi:hypothetical protein